MYNIGDAGQKAEGTDFRLFLTEITGKVACSQEVPQMHLVEIVAIRKGSSVAVEGGVCAAGRELWRLRCLDEGHHTVR